MYPRPFRLVRASVLLVPTQILTNLLQGIGQWLIDSRRQNFWTTSDVSWEVHQRSSRFEQYLHITRFGLRFECHFKSV